MAGDAIYIHSAVYEVDRGGEDAVPTRFDDDWFVNDLNDSRLSYGLIGSI